MPDSSPNVPVPGALSSREASAQAAAADGHPGSPAPSAAGLGDSAPAAVLERWNVVNRVLPDDGFAEAARAYAHQVAAGPTVAHAATKQLVTTAVRQGARAADDLVPAVSGALFATDDLRGAVNSFLSDGPGRATYAGR